MNINELHYINRYLHSENTTKTDSNAASNRHKRHHGEAAAQKWQK
jgi:hypothetical protein